VLAPEAGRIAAVDLRYPNGFAVAWRAAGTTDSPEGGA
jgi:cell division septal protein FtsQ